MIPEIFLKFSKVWMKIGDRRRKLTWCGSFVFIWGTVNAKLRKYRKQTSYSHMTKHSMRTLDILRLSLRWVQGGWPWLEDLVLGTVWGHRVVLDYSLARTLRKTLLLVGENVSLEQRQVHVTSFAATAVFIAIARVEQFDEVSSFTGILAECGCTSATRILSDDTGSVTQRERFRSTTPCSKHQQTGCDRKSKGEGKGTTRARQGDWTVAEKWLPLDMSDRQPSAKEELQTESSVQTQTSTSKLRWTELLSFWCLLLPARTPSWCGRGQLSLQWTMQEEFQCWPSHVQEQTPFWRGHWETSSSRAWKGSRISHRHQMAIFCFFSFVEACSWCSNLVERSIRSFPMWRCEVTAPIAMGSAKQQTNSCFQTCPEAAPRPGRLRQPAGPGPARIGQSREAR